MTPPFILLDAGQALLFIVPVLFILHLVITLFIEGGILYWFNYGTFKKCLYHAFIANLCSLILGVFLISPILDLVVSIFGYHNKDANLLCTLLFCFLLTILVEGFVLMCLNKTLPFGKLAAATLVMNFSTYLILYLFMQLIR